MNTYRKYIDGLRAVAIIPVIIFHLNSSWLPGGFVGVDIFFVISGYLITGHIYQAVVNKQFSFNLFYIKRIKRILPPLYISIFMTLILGWLFFLPYDYYKIGFSSISSVLFLANVNFFLRTGGYFDSQANQWPLLHNWSLSVEEQFYFFIPVAIVLLYRYKKKLILPFIFVVLCFSFVLSEMASDSSSWASFSYYMLPTRAGELLVGAFLSIFLMQRKQNYLNIPSFFSVLSLLFIIVSFFIYDKNMVFPGFMALPICLAAVLIIGVKCNVVHNILSTKLLVFIGLMSYSLYLCHWPVFATFRYITQDFLGTINWYIYVMLIISVFVLSLFTYFIVEKKTRYARMSIKSVYIYYLCIPSLILFVISFLVVYSEGAKERFSNDGLNPDLSLAHIERNKCNSNINAPCVGGFNSAGETIALYGNSHAEHFFTLFDKMGKEFGFSVELIASGGCDYFNGSTKCSIVNNYFDDNLSKFDKVLIAYRWETLFRDDEYENKLKDLLVSMKNVNQNIIIIGQAPSWDSSVSSYWNCSRLFGDSNCHSPKKIDNYINIKLRAIAKSLGLKYIEPTLNTYLERHFTDKTGELLYFDDNHLSVYGNQVLFELKKTELYKVIFGDK